MGAPPPMFNVMLSSLTGGRPQPCYYSIRSSFSPGDGFFVKVILKNANYTCRGVQEQGEIALLGMMMREGV
jgi:hypothetical protein